MLEPVADVLVHLRGRPRLVLVQDDPGPVYRLPLGHLKSGSEVVRVQVRGVKPERSLYSQFVRDMSLFMVMNFCLLKKHHRRLKFV